VFLVPGSLGLLGIKKSPLLWDSWEVGSPCFSGIVGKYRKSQVFWNNWDLESRKSLVLCDSWEVGSLWFSGIVGN